MDIKVLLKVVPKHGTGDKASEYCIDGFAIDRYDELLIELHMARIVRCLVQLLMFQLDVTYAHVAATIVASSSWSSWTFVYPRWYALFLADWHAALAREMPCRSHGRQICNVPMQ